jgi:hypothetical protein
MTLKKLVPIIMIPLCALFTLIMIAVNTVAAAGAGTFYPIFGGFTIFLIIMGYIHALLFVGVSALLFFCLYEKEEPKPVFWGSLGFAAFCYIFLILYFIGGETGDGVISIFGFIIGLLLSGYGLGLLRNVNMDGHFARLCCRQRKPAGETAADAEKPPAAGETPKDDVDEAVKEDTDEKD